VGGAPETDDELAACLVEARTAFAHLHDRSWFAWGSLLLPHLAPPPSPPPHSSPKPVEETEDPKVKRTKQLAEGLDKWMANEIDDETWNQIQAECTSPPSSEVNEPPVPTLVPSLPVVLPILTTDSGIPVLLNPTFNPRCPSPRPLRQPRAGPTPLPLPPVIMIPAKRRRDPSPKFDKEEGPSMKPMPAPQRRPTGPLRVMTSHFGPRSTNHLPPPSPEKQKSVSSHFSLSSFLLSYSHSQLPSVIAVRITKSQPSASGWPTSKNVRNA
jgi:hypothetical protein